MRSRSSSPGRGRSSGPTGPPAAAPIGTPPRSQPQPRRGRRSTWEIIEASVAAHLVADVPVATFLSGGLDSSIVSVLAKRANPDLEAYTIRFRPEDHRLEATPDDAVYARLVARRHDIRLHEIEIAPDAVNLLPRMVDILDEPIGDPAAINTLLICEAARDAGVKVLLSGTGADELFGGYRKHLACIMAARYQRMPDFALGAVNAVVDHIPVTAAGRGLRYARWAKRFLTFSQLPEEAAFRRSYTLYDPEDLAALVSPDLDAQVGAVIDEHLAVYDDNDLADHVNRMCLADSRLFLPASTSRTPTGPAWPPPPRSVCPSWTPWFRAAFSLPGDQKVHGRTQKFALKEAARRWLPKEVVERPKASFSAPLRAWVAHDLRELSTTCSSVASSSRRASSAASAVNRLIEEERSGRGTGPSTSGSC